MEAASGWHAYGMQSYRLQFADGILFRRSGRRSRRERALMRPGEVVVIWPGWDQLAVSGFSRRRV